MTTADGAARPAPIWKHSKTTLPYADLPARWGVSVERLPDGGVRVVVPPVPGWRQLHAGFYIGGAVLALFVAFGAFMAYESRDWAPLIGNGITYGGGLLWVVLGAQHRLRRRVVLEVNGTTVSVTHVSGRRHGRRTEWPRAKVAEIKLNGSNGKLIIRIAGVAFVEFYLGPNRELNAYVAQTLSAALREPVAAEAVASSTVVAREGAAETPSHFDGVRSRTVRRILLVLCASMALGGVGLMFLPFPAGVIGTYVLLFSIAPAGIALGTQEKEFYF